MMVEKIAPFGSDQHLRNERKLVCAIAYVAAVATWVASGGPSSGNDNACGNYEAEVTEIVTSPIPQQ